MEGLKPRVHEDLDDWYGDAIFFIDAHHVRASSQHKRALNDARHAEVETLLSQFFGHSENLEGSEAAVSWKHLSLENLDWPKHYMTSHSVLIHLWRAKQLQPGIDPLW